MAENEKKSSKTVVILLIIVIILLIGGAVSAMLLLNRDTDSGEAEEEFSVSEIGYDEAAVILDEKKLQDKVDELYKEAEEGSMTLQFKNIAYSTDGTHFICEIGNSSENIYDMYFNIYLDVDFTEQILLTGLFPPGSGIKEFDSDIPLEDGTYKAVLVLTQVNDDHKTLHAQSYVNINLIVGETE